MSTAYSARLSPWPFHTCNRDGELTHAQEATEARYECETDGKVTKMTYLPTPHTFRGTFRSVGHACGVDEYTVKVLMNHALPSGKGNVSDGYLMPDAGYGDPLRAGVEKIAKVLLTKKRSKRKIAREGMATMRIVA